MENGSITTRAGGLIALLALSLAGSGCDKTPPYRAAKAAFSEDIALTGAYAPFVRAKGGSQSEREVAYLAMKKLVEVAKHADKIPVEKGDFDSPTAALNLYVGGLSTWCSPLLQGPESLEEARKKCVENIDKLDERLGDLEKSAVAAGMPAGSFPRLDAAVTPAAREKAAPLARVTELTAEEKAYAALKADPKAEAKALSEACQKAMDSRKTAERTGDPDVDKLLIDRQRFGAAECIGLLGLQLTVDLVKSCEGPAAPSSCWDARMCEPFPSVMEPPAAFAEALATMKRRCAK